VREALLPVHFAGVWFLPLFVLMWLVITGGLARLGGWSSLATQFRASRPASGEWFRFVSGSMGKSAFPVSYGGCLFVCVSEAGIALSILFLFRLLSPPLFIPWSQVASVEKKRLLFVRYVVIRLRNQWPVISIRGPAGQRIEEVFARVLPRRVL
jgi:hypothetical protein